MLRDYAKDSLLAGFNSQYFLTDDSCVEIVRHSQFDFVRKRFFGGFKDVRKDDTTKVIAQGNYNKYGLRDGRFISYYTNGNLQAKGAFRNNRYSGDWAFYYEDGSPEIMFTDTNDIITIHNAWTKDHKKIIDEGKGEYQIPYGVTRYWTGRLVNGRPDGEWRLYQRINSDTSEILMEHWDNGKFLSGENKAQTYVDSTHIVLVNDGKLPLINAEKLRITRSSCNIVKVDFVNAKYAPGDKKLFNYFDELTEDYIEYSLKNKKTFPSYSKFLSIFGEIDESGHLVDLSSIENSRSAKYMMDCLTHYIPQFQPATANGKPVRQQISFVFDFNQREVKYSYQLLPDVL